MTTSSPMPAGLRERVLAASRAARATGRALPSAPVISPVEAYSRAADAFHGLLCALTPEQWHAPVLRDLDVQGLVGHLIGVERDVQRALSGDTEVADADHIASTQPDAARQAGRPTEQTRDEWRRAADRSLELVPRDDDGAVLSMHGMRLPVGALLVVRAFELWTHENDVRRATRLPASVPDASTLALMTDLAVTLLPHGAARAASLPAAVDLHLVLTGAGGGTWDVVLGDATAGPRSDLLVVVDAVDFCRLVADRVDPADLDVHVGGATEHADGVLAAAAALALD